MTKPNSKPNDNFRGRAGLAALDRALSRLDQIDAEGGFQVRLAAQPAAKHDIGDIVSFMDTDGSLRTGAVVDYRPWTSPSDAGMALLVKCAQFEHPTMVFDEQLKQATALMNGDIDIDALRVDLVDARLVRADLQVVNELVKADGTYLGRVAFTRAKGVPTRDDLAQLLGDDVQLHTFTVSAAGNAADVVGLMSQEALAKQAGPKEWMAGAGLAMGLMGAPQMAQAQPGSYDPNNMHTYQQGNQLDSKEQSELASLPPKMQKLRSSYERAGGSGLKLFEQASAITASGAADIGAQLVALNKQHGNGAFRQVISDGYEHGKLAKRQKELSGRGAGGQAGAQVKAPLAKGAQLAGADSALVARLASDFTQALHDDRLTVDQLESAIYHRASTELRGAGDAHKVTLATLQVMREKFAGPDLDPSHHRAMLSATAAKSTKDKNPKAEFEMLEFYQQGSTVCIVAKMKNQQSVSDWGLRIQFRRWCEMQLQKLDGPIYSLVRGGLRLAVDRKSNRATASTTVGQRTGLPVRQDAGPLFNERFNMYDEEDA